MEIIVYLPKLNVFKTPLKPAHNFCATVFKRLTQIFSDRFCGNVANLNTDIKEKIKTI